MTHECVGLPVQERQRLPGKTWIDRAEAATAFREKRPPRCVGH